MTHPSPPSLVILGKIHNLETSCYKRAVPECSNPEHLFLGTNADNMRDMGNKGRSKFHKARFRGTDHGMAKLTDDVVRSIRADRAQGCTYGTLATRYSISRSLACQVALRQIWKHVE